MTNIDKGAGSIWHLILQRDDERFRIAIGIGWILVFYAVCLFILSVS